jgi:RNA 2',3'-cyclic 3'-phosphodiesterase
MRLFVALPLPDQAREAIAPMLAAGAKATDAVRWVNGDNLHLTVKFLGEAPPDAAESIARVLETATRGTPALPVTIADVGGAPNLNRVRVLWLELVAPPALELLAHAVERACERLGFPLEQRVFRPHVTLGRVRDGQRVGASLVTRLQELKPDIGFVLDSLVLFSSRTGPAGAAYTPLASIPLVQ